MIKLMKILKAINWTIMQSIMLVAMILLGWNLSTYWYNKGFQKAVSQYDKDFKSAMAKSDSLDAIAMKLIEENR